MQIITRTLLISLCFTFFILSGCSIYGPTYKKPKVNVPDRWKSTDELSISTNYNLPVLPWWKQFNDSVLNQLIDDAVLSNNDLQAAAGKVIDAEGQLMQVQYSIVPSINALLIGYANTKINIYRAGYSSGVLPEYALNLFQYLRSSEKAKAELQSSCAKQDAVKLAVISQTAAGYFHYLGQTYLAHVQFTLVKDLKELLALARLQYKDGLISLYELQAYEQDYEKAKAELPIIKNNVVMARNSLRVLLNENPGDIGIGSKFMSLKSNHLVPANLPSQVLQNRPDVRASEQDLVAATAQIGVITSTFFPTLSLTGLAGAGSQQLSQMFTGNGDYWNQLMPFTMPLVAPEYPGQHKSAEGLRYKAYHDYIQTIRAAFKSVDDDLSAHKEYYRSLVAEGKNFASSEEAYKLAQDSYKEGLYSYPTLLVNKVNMDKAAIDLTKSKIAQLTTIVRLYQDLGAGYAYHTKTAST